MNPKISVVIPVYNGEKFLTKAIHSVLVQEYPAHEIIVVNDGSTDGTAEVMHSFGDKIIARTIPNGGGPSRPRNLGVRLSTGDYIAFLDADDFWFRGKLKKFSEFILKYPEVGLFGSNYILRLDEWGVPRRVSHSSLIRRSSELVFNEPLKGRALAVLLGENFVGTPSAVVMKRSAFDTCGFFKEDCHMAEDLELYLRFAISQDFVIIDDILLYKYSHPAGISFEKVRLYTGHKKVLVDFYDGYRDVLERRGLLRNYGMALAELNYTIGNAYFESRQKKKALASYVEALKASRTTDNLALFLWVLIKKTFRILTFDKLNRQNLGY